MIAEMHNASCVEYIVSGLAIRKSRAADKKSEMADGFCFWGGRTVSNVFPKGIILF